jgi:hypothetical protein
LNSSSSVAGLVSTHRIPCHRGRPMPGCSRGATSTPRQQRGTTNWHPTGRDGMA